MPDVASILSKSLAGRYAIERELGRGGMATVWLARDLRYGREVAVKILKAELAAALGTDRFLREVEILARLHHPHILALFDSGEIPDFYGPGVPAPYFVMPYVAGESLRHRLRREGALPLDDALAIARDVAGALGYAHGEGVIHRDVKPENILLDGGHAIVADFGVARAVDRAGGDMMSSPGLAVGTPSYMSPEQSTGGDLDGRSDVYALGCVLYEMLAGEPPFGGATPQIVAARHLHDPPPALRTVRPNLPPWVTTVVERALAKIPADRFQSGAAFATALASPTVTTELPVPPRRRRRWWWPFAIALVALGGGLLLGRRDARPVALDADRYLVLPFLHRGAAAPELVNGDQCQALIYDALGRWRDVRLVNAFRVSDELSRDGAPATLSAGLRIARGLGAGRLLWGEVSELADTVRVYAAVYDVSRPAEALREAHIRMPSRDADVGGSFAALADSLMLGHAPTAAVASALRGTTSLAAWRAFRAGDSALGRWDLETARRRFGDALALDSTFPQPSLWLAQVADWTGDPSPEWEPQLRRASAGASRLSPYERDVALALGALAEGRFPDACARYSALVARDSEDVAGWIGLGECRARDSVVLRDARSPSGWRFRSSYEAAAQAYRKALEIVPSVHRASREVALRELDQVLFYDPGRYRPGVPLPPDSGRFGALAGLDRDTFAFVPLPLADLLAGRPPLPQRAPAAAERARALLGEVAATWVRAFPRSADAHEAQAIALETAGDVTGPASAAAAVARAIALSSDTVQRARLAVAAARLAAKAGRWDEAARIADSALAPALPVPTGDAAAELAGLAALRGRLATLLDLEARAGVRSFVTSDGQLVELPPEIAGDAAKLAAREALGADGDSVRAGVARLERLISARTSAADRETYRRAAFDFAGKLGFPAFGLGPTHRAGARADYLMEAQWSLAHGDRAGVLRQLAAVHALRANARPGDVSVDATYQEVVLAAAAGDSAGARREAHAALDALPTAGSDLLDGARAAGALVRLLALAAELDAAAGDTAAARGSAAAVVTLWRDADPALQPLVARMAALAR